MRQLETYWAILEKVRGSTLRLTKLDDDIYEHLQKDFPEFDAAETIDEDKMKSKAGKEQWGNFMMAYEKKVDDYNFGTILRLSPKSEYGEKETIFGLYTSHPVSSLPAPWFQRTPASTVVLPHCRPGPPCADHLYLQSQGCNSTLSRLPGKPSRLRKRVLAGSGVSFTSGTEAVSTIGYMRRPKPTSKAAGMLGKNRIARATT